MHRLKFIKGRAKGKIRNLPADRQVRELRKAK
jgi:hypothetical protein